MALGHRFLLDREKLSDDAVSGMEASTDKKLRFLPRRCLECYTIDLEAISSVISEELGDVIPTGELAQQIASLASERDMGGASFFDGNLENIDWLKRVDGAKLLKGLFERVTDNRLEFRKTHHTPLLMAKIAPERLTELSSLLKTCVAEIVEADL
ncbi:MAG: hypothetical protein C0515_03075 [Novosphingobium sp.]|nr:hypothetical protein [Novosphingobium sp.]